jgi:hypothetical protein
VLAICSFTTVGLFMFIHAVVADLLILCYLLKMLLIYVPLYYIYCTGMQDKSIIVGSSGINRIVTTRGRAVGKEWLPTVRLLGEPEKIK